MKTLKFIFGLGMVLLALLFVQCDDEILFPENSSQNQVMEKKTTIKAPDGETAGNNLSFPVLWSDGIGKELRGNLFDEPVLNGEWWYVWGEDPVDPSFPVFSCQPDLTKPNACLDGTIPGDGSSTVYKAYVQKDLNNVWQAFNATPTGMVFVDEVDWGDDLESVDWTINSMVRCEVVLFEALDDETYQDVNSKDPITLPEFPEFPMKHVFGWGSEEVHGMAMGESAPAYDLAVGDMATVYSHNARFTIQKLNVSDLAELEGNLEWNQVTNSWEGLDGAENLVNEPIYNMGVWEAGDGPGYYNAEINVKGKIIYGYTWKVRSLNQGEGYYRLTFNLDKEDGPVTCNTFFDANTKILLAEEEDTDEEDGETEHDRGGIGVMDVDNNLTYMDILITPKTKGAGGGKGGNGTPGGGKGRN